MSDKIPQQQKFDHGTGIKTTAKPFALQGMGLEGVDVPLPDPRGIDPFDDPEGDSPSKNFMNVSYGTDDDDFSR